MFKEINKYFFQTVVGGFAVGFSVYSLVKYFAGGVCHCTTRLDGRIVVITGGTSGIGKALAIELAKKGADIILAYRDLEKALQAKAEIESKNKHVTVYIQYLDLSKTTSIVEFSETLNNRFTKIYALVNNAGVFYCPQGLTDDGFEITLQTNYLGHFVLTHHLLKLLKKSDQARIINVSSEAHKNVYVDQLFALTTSHEEVKDHFVAYGVSKLALVLFTKELSKKLSNTNVIVTSVNPGNVETSIFRTFPPLSNPWLFALQWPIRCIVIKSPYQGAQTILHTLLAPDTNTGGYYTDCKLVESNPIATDNKTAEEYYQLTMKILSTWVNQDLQL